MGRSREEKNKSEQNRVRMLCGAFQQLKELLPDNQYVKTKAEILSSAAEYIKFLELKLQEVEERRALGTPFKHQPRPSCRYAKGQQEVSYLTRPAQYQGQSSMPCSVLSASYQDIPQDCLASSCTYQACELQGIYCKSSWFVSNNSNSDQLGDQICSSTGKRYY